MKIACAFVILLSAALLFSQVHGDPAAASDVDPSSATPPKAPLPSEAGLLVAYVALFTMALLPIYIGSHLSLNDNGESESVDNRAAYMFPVIGSAVLFSLYLMFKFLSKDWVNFILSLYFCVLGLTAVVSIIHTVLGSAFPALAKEGRWSVRIHIPYILESSSDKGGDKGVMVGVHEIISFVLGGGAIGWYFFTKHWVANNIFGLSFSVMGIQLINLASFSTGCILLCGLFFYDIFWVFATDVMVTVAKSFDAPIKLVFPRDVFQDMNHFAMLGLGDIVVPGIFVALMLRFDRHLAAKSNRVSNKKYFQSCFIGYMAGLGTTMFVMHVFHAAQPALLYLVPGCLGSVIITAWANGELKELWAYEEEDKSKKSAADGDAPTAPAAGSGTETKSSEQTAPVATATVTAPVEAAVEPVVAAVAPQPSSSSSSSPSVSGSTTRRRTRQAD